MKKKKIFYKHKHRVSLIFFTEIKSNIRYRLYYTGSSGVFLENPFYYIIF